MEPIGSGKQGARVQSFISRLVVITRVSDEISQAASVLEFPSISLPLTKVKRDVVAIRRRNGLKDGVVPVKKPCTLNSLWNHWWSIYISLCISQ
jgi:hypothetical protein